MKLIAEITIDFDDEELHPSELDEEEIRDALASAVSECNGIESEASVEVTKLTIAPSGAAKKARKYVHMKEKPNAR